MRTRLVAQRYAWEQVGTRIGWICLLACMVSIAGWGIVSGKEGGHEGGTVLSPSMKNAEKVLKEWEAYISLSPEKRKEKGVPFRDISSFSKEDARKWRTFLWQAWVERMRRSVKKDPVPFVDSPPGGKGVVEVMFPGRTGKIEKFSMKYTIKYVLPKKKKGKGKTQPSGKTGEEKKKKLPLYINFHAGGNSKRMNDQQWRIGQGYYRIPYGIYICPRAPIDVLESWIVPPIYPLLDKLLQQCFALRNVDSNRVYILGYSMGGWGTFHLAPVMADYWAAAAASAGGGFVRRSPPFNLRNTPMMIQIGAKDYTYRRYFLAKSYADALKKLHARDPQGYVFKYKEHPGKGHFINDKDTPRWLSQFTRNPIPEKIVWCQAPFPQRPGFSWIRIADPKPSRGQVVIVSRKGNTIHVEKTAGVNRLTFLFDDRMVDLDKPVRIVQGEREVFNGRVPRTLDVLVEMLFERGDPEMMFYAAVTVPISAEKKKQEKGK